MNPGINLDTHIADVANVFEFEELSDVVLVGHSYGGMVITGVADRSPDKIRSMVYLDAFVPQNGNALINFLPPDHPRPAAASEYTLAPLPAVFLAPAPKLPPSLTRTPRRCRPPASCRRSSSPAVSIG